MQPAAQNQLAYNAGFLVDGLPWTIVASQALVDHQLLIAYPLKPVPLLAPVRK
jgi:hypothetical protein